MKKYSIVFSSATGNTEALAKALAEMLPQEELAYFGAPEGLSDGAAPDSEFVCAGFWIMRGEPDPASKEFFPKLAGKKVFLFGTAGFSLSSAYFDEILEKTKKELPPGAEYLGGFMCAGQMPMETCLKYRAALMSHPNDRKLMGMIDSFDRASTHPDEADFEAFRKKTKKVLSL